MPQLLTGPAARCLMPGTQMPELSMSPGEMLRFATMQRSLRRLALPWFTAEAKFITENAGVHPALLSDRQVHHFNRLGWRYRARLPTGIAPCADPDKRTDI